MTDLSHGRTDERHGAERSRRRSRRRQPAAAASPAPPAAPVDPVAAVTPIFPDDTGVFGARGSTLGL
jgi:hypothetical protein